MTNANYPVTAIREADDDKKLTFIQSNIILKHFNDLKNHDTYIQSLLIEKLFLTENPILVSHNIIVT